MADIGVLPSKTSVSITSSNGENGTIPAATPSAAGVMTAEHVKKLERVYSAIETGTVHLEPIVIEAPQPRAPVDAVTRGELRTVVAEIQRTISATPQPLPALTDDSLMERIAALEAREMSQERRLQEMAQLLDQALGMLGEVQNDQKFLEHNSLAAVQVKAA